MSTRLPSCPTSRSRRNRCERAVTAGTGLTHLPCSPEYDIAVPDEIGRLKLEAALVCRAGRARSAALSLRRPTASNEHRAARHAASSLSLREFVHCIPAPLCSPTHRTRTRSGRHKALRAARYQGLVKASRLPKVLKLNAFVHRIPALCGSHKHAEKEPGAGIARLGTQRPVDNLAAGGGSRERQPGCRTGPGTIAAGTAMLLTSQGAFGLVTKGFLKTASGEVVECAIKTLKAGALDLDRESLKAEARLVAKFQHPNVVALLGQVRALAVHHAA